MVNRVRKGIHSERMEENAFTKALSKESKQWPMWEWASSHQTEMIYYELLLKESSPIRNAQTSPQ